MDTIEGKIVGLLHDVLEDSDFAVDDLIDDGFPPEIIDAVIALTRKKEENYQQFILRCKENPLARQVKLADLEDNLDTTRLPEIGEKERQRIKKYEQAVLILQA
jgi:(p)ppGpp synthase/HD superfamily hydrolase